jgi:poly(ADP-ribose) glycohydrolase ARH3
MSPDKLKDRFRGCLLGLAVGDALGGRFEAQSAEAIRSRFPNAQALIAYPDDELWYTDDTQMTIGVAEALIADGEIVEERLCRMFAANYVPSRGYGRGARAVLEAMEEGRDYVAVAESYFPGGSYGNGAAMRVAPVGLLFRDEPEQLREQARLSAIPTHRHPLGIEGAQLLATAIADASHTEQFEQGAFFDELVAACIADEYRQRVGPAAAIQDMSGIPSLGNGIEALQSVPTALASFALTPDSYEDTIGNVILLGGDTDTLAAMAGALSGAYVGAARLPTILVSHLERSPKGYDYLLGLADSLFDRYCNRSMP